MSGNKNSQGTDSAQDASTMHAQIQEMLPRLRERAAQTRSERKVPAETVRELQDMGFFLCLQPKRYGGYEMTPQEFFRNQILLAQGCMSSAWASGIIAVHSFQ
ncbi:MAG: acyl-CoA dehydrogenase family protein, partial [Pseudomonadales bacterium]